MDLKARHDILHWLRHALALCLLCALPAASAQSTGSPVIGVLFAFSPPDAALWRQAFQQGLRDLGWVEGKNIRIEFRYGGGKADRLPGLAAELVGLRVDLIVAASAADALAAKQATSSIPIVMAFAGDVIATGLVSSLARPGGNITGLTQMTPELAGKRLELLKEIFPDLTRAAVLWNPQGRTSRISWDEMQLPARKLGVELYSLEARSTADFGRAFDEAAEKRAQALIVMPDPLFVTNLKAIAHLAATRRLPSMLHLREFAEAGGLVAYGPDRSEMSRRAATYVDRILKGAKPADLPVEQPTKFDLVLNLKTARALGIKIPRSVVMRADSVIE